MKHRPAHAAHPEASTPEASTPEASTPETQPPERWVIDALEDAPGGQLARVELPDGSTRDLPLTDLPAGAREGDILHVQHGPTGLTVHVQPRETQQVAQAAQERLEALNRAGAQAGEEITL